MDLVLSFGEAFIKKYDCPIIILMPYAASHCLCRMWRKLDSMQNQMKGACVFMHNKNLTYG